MLHITPSTEHFIGDPRHGGDVITWAVGHLVRTRPVNHIQRWSLNTLPLLPSQWEFEVVEKTAKHYQAVKQLFQRADEVVCATDAGREGELIFRLIYQSTGVKVPFYRLWISSQTDEAIVEGWVALCVCTW